MISWSRSAFLTLITLFHIKFYFSTASFTGRLSPPYDTNPTIEKNEFKYLSNIPKQNLGLEMCKTTLQYPTYVLEEGKTENRVYPYDQSDIFIPKKTDPNFHTLAWGGLEETYGTSIGDGLTNDKNFNDVEKTSSNSGRGLEEWENQFLLKPQTYTSSSSLINTASNNQESFLQYLEPDFDPFRKEDKTNFDATQDLPLTSNIGHINDMDLGEKYTHFEHKEVEEPSLYPGEEGGSNQVLSFIQINQVAKKLPVSCSSKTEFENWENNLKEIKLQMQKQAGKYRDVGVNELYESDATYFEHGYKIHEIMRKAVTALKRQSIQNFCEWKKFEEKLFEKQKQIKRLYNIRCGNPGLMVINQKSSHDSGYSITDKTEAIILSSREAKRTIDSNVIIKKIHKIGEALHICHNFFAMNGLDKDILNKIDGNHNSILEWYYNLIFMEDGKHPPLLGSINLSQRPQSRKFNDSQIQLIQYILKDSMNPRQSSKKDSIKKASRELNDFQINLIPSVIKDSIRPGKSAKNNTINKAVAFCFALDLVELWFKEESLKQGTTLNDDKYSQLASFAVAIADKYIRKRKKI